MTYTDYRHNLQLIKCSMGWISLVLIIIYMCQSSTCLCQLLTCLYQSMTDRRTLFIKPPSELYKIVGQVGCGRAWSSTQLLQFIHTPNRQSYLIHVNDNDIAAIKWKGLTQYLWFRKLQGTAVQYIGQHRSPREINMIAQWGNGQGQ